MTRTVNTSSITLSGVPAIPLASRSRGPENVLARLSAMLSVRAERQRLASLDERTLRDLGLSRADVERETTRSLFDIPTNRS
jgi:uncharacterized protein YjiS (DUF1127 family)